MTSARLLAVLPGLALAAACTDEMARAPDGAHLLPLSPEEQFWIGDETGERTFTHIPSMAFGPNGRPEVPAEGTEEAA